MSRYRYQPAPEGKDPVLWEVAQKRANFKKHLVTYVIMNSFFWAIWFVSSGRHQMDLDFNIFSWNHFPWPIWPMLGWGIGLAFNYADAYIFPKSNSIETEYEKLKNLKK